MDKTVTIPSQVVTIANFIGDNWAVVVVGLLTGLLTMAAVAYYRHRYTLKHLQDLGKLAIHGVVLFIAALMSALEYAIPFLQTNLVVLEKLPFFGAYVVFVAYAANWLYAIKGKAWFQKWFKTAQKLDAKLSPAVTPSVPSTPNLPEEESQFQSL